ncbi:MAG: RimK/LysX family protein [Phormidesmis sp.]
MTVSKQTNLPVIGWRERVALPDLEITSVKAKIDTGARSSALHAFDIETFKQQGVDFVRFKVHPSQRSRNKIVIAEAKLLEMRTVRNSGGQAESRPVIETTVSAGGQQWPIELTLTNRDVMGFRMLLGRQAVRQRFLVDSGSSYLQSSARIRKFKGRKDHNENSTFVKKFLSLFDKSS